MAKLILSKCLTIFTVIGLFFGTLAAAGGNVASASSATREGQFGNDLVCGGVHTLGKAEYIARGGSVKCANGTIERGIGKVWAAEGMTLQVIERMKLGTICSTQGYTSSGRELGPDPSKNVHREVGGVSFYTRPLSVWGYACYQSWKGSTEDGVADGIMVNCGNGLFKHYPPGAPAPKPKVVCYLGNTPEYSVPVGYTVQNGNCVNIAAQACAVNYGGNWNSVTGICTVTQGNCDTLIVINGSGNTVNVTYNNSCNTTVTTQPAPTTTTTMPPPTTTTTRPPPTTTTTLPPPTTTTTQPPPTTTTTTLPPPKPQPPTISGLTQPQEVSVSGTDVPGTTPFSADISAPKGDSITVVWSAQYGSFPNSAFTLSGGVNEVITTYDAPSEVPPLSTINGVTNNWDTVTVLVYDNTTGLSVSKSVSFPILPPASRP